MTQYSDSCLRVRHAVVRFDAVPKNIVSDVLEQTVLDAPGDILEWEYDFRRSIPAAVFWEKFESDLSGWLGNEVRRLRKHKWLKSPDMSLTCLLKIGSNLK